MATFSIRKARPADAESLLELTSCVLKESVFSLTEPDELYYTPEEEKKWIEESTQNPNHLILVVEADDRIVGSLDFSNGHRRRISHTGDLGMQVSTDFRNQGVGTALMEALLDWANQNPTIERISLRVHSDNARAIHLYEKMGFEKEGHLKGELKYGPGQYVDTFIYTKWIKNQQFC